MKSAIALIIVGGIVAIIVGPLCVIWAINTLFPSVTIPYTFETWISAAILCNIFRVTVNTKKD
jgi:hypothetical protein